MATEYTIQQGDTLQRIAKQHGFQRGSTLYEHPENAAFRALRPDPNLIYPGDKIKIPDVEPAVQKRPTNGRHTFTLKAPETEKLRIKLIKRSGEVLSAKRVVLIVGDEKIDTEINPDGFLETDLPKGTETNAQLEIYTKKGSEQPTNIFELKLAHLDPLDEISGVQGRCNALGYDCGRVDGDLGEKTSGALKRFQRSQALEETGEITEATKACLKEKFGC